MYSPPMSARGAPAGLQRPERTARRAAARAAAADGRLGAKSGATRHAWRGSAAAAARQATGLLKHVAGEPRIAMPPNGARERMAGGAAAQAGCRRGWTTRGGAAN